MSPPKTTCKNCENQFDPSYQFCPHCGQKSNDKLTMKVLFHNTVSNYFCVDARFLKSFVPLMIRPGFLPKKFVEGKRLTYLHPAQTYLFISIIFFFLFSFEASEQQRTLNEVWSSDSEDNVEITEKPDQETAQKSTSDKKVKNIGPFISYSETETPEVQDEKASAAQNEDGVEVDIKENEIDSLIAAGAPQPEILKAMGMDENPSWSERKLYEQMLKVYTREGSGILQSFYNTFPVAMFFLLPVFGFLLKLFYFKKGPFANHMVFSFYFFSFLFLVFSLLLLLNFIWEIPDWINNLAMLSTFFYLLLGVRRFYGESYFLGFIKSSLVAFLFFIFVIPLTLAIMMLVAFMFY